MDLAGETFQVAEDYQVELPPGDHLTILAGAHLGEPAYRFDHPNVAAKKSELFEFKHYRKSGSKFWTAKAGISFYFVLPKAQIELLPEKGYSYVPVLIQGRKYHLNVSGWSGDAGWTDCVRQKTHIGSGCTIAILRSLATSALQPAECQAQGITMEIEALKDCQHAGFIDAAAAVTMRSRMGPGSQLFLRDGWEYMGSRGPFVFESRPHRKRYSFCVCGTAPARIQDKAIDWTKTAEANGVAVPQPVLVNHIGAVVELAAI
jgi:hypothetical protein